MGMGVNQHIHKDTHIFRKIVASPAFLSLLSESRRPGRRPGCCRRSTCCRTTFRSEAGSLGKVSASFGESPGTVWGRLNFVPWTFPIEMALQCPLVPIWRGRSPLSNSTFPIHPKDLPHLTQRSISQLPNPCRPTPVSPASSASHFLLPFLCRPSSRALLPVSPSPQPIAPGTSLPLRPSPSHFPFGPPHRPSQLPLGTSLPLRPSPSPHPR